MRSTAELIGELRILRLSDPLAGAVLELEIARRSGSIDTGSYTPPESLLCSNPSAII
jgi:hypothetical protein